MIVINEWIGALKAFILGGKSSDFMAEYFVLGRLKCLHLHGCCVKCINIALKNKDKDNTGFEQNFVSFIN